MTGQGAAGRGPMIAVVLSLAQLAGFCLWSEVDPRSLAVWSLEDGPIENATASLFLISGIGFFVFLARSDFLKAKGTKRA